MTLKSVFYGSRNEFDEIIVDWLSQHTNLVGVVWSTSGKWKYSMAGRIRQFRARMRKYGLWKVINETLNFIVFHSFLAKRDQDDLRELVYKPYHSQHGKPIWKGNEIYSDNVNDASVVNFVRECNPDIGFAMCINDYFGKQIRELPRYGTFLWHEGFIPEYSGLYAPFWALTNLDFERLGYAFLKMNSSIDAGDVFCIGKVKGIDPYYHLHNAIGHKAIYDSLPEVSSFLEKLEVGEARPVTREIGRPETYTYPGLTDLILQRYRIYRHRKAS